MATLKFPAPPNNMYCFDATLYFDAPVKLDMKTLFNSWAREDYECELVSAEKFTEEHKKYYEYLLFRGNTNLRFGKGGLFDHADEPLSSHYPEVSKLNLPYDKTHLIDQNAAWIDFKSAKYRIPLRFVMPKERTSPLVALNEFNLSLLGIRQAYPLRAFYFEPAELLVGQKDIEEYTEYANSNSEQKPRYAYPITFGVFVKNNNNIISAYTSGLNIHGHSDLYMEIQDTQYQPIEVAQLLFNSACYITDGNSYRSGQSMSSGSISCKIEDVQFNGKSYLKLVPTS